MIDGDDATLDAQVATLRIGNHLQIFNGTVGVSRRANIVKKAGRGAEMAYLKGKKMLELKRNIEASGVLDPIWMYEGKFLDGRNRVWATRVLNSEGKTWKRLNAEGEVVEIAV